MVRAAGGVVAEDVDRGEVSLGRKLAAEGVGTFLLVFGGVGAAVLAGSRVGALGVSLAFGFVLLCLAYTLGRVSGCHVNPAVTLGHLLLGRIHALTAALYTVAQAVGALVGGMLVYVVANGLPDYHRETDGLAANGWGEYGPHQAGKDGFGLGSAIVVEVVLTALLVLVVLAVTDKVADTALAGVAIGLTLAMTNLVAIPVDNASINPARSLASAPFQEDAWGQLWAFIVFPLLGGALGALAYAGLFGSKRPATP
ncbi:AraC family transcriptional regulator [Nocardia sp. ET3-3]|uniref:AraC family transcriptional regulator n=1 Tax=Nocardia terrae TaxID=2675851 RepID=A0A7K1V9B7_9NOCA|nr:aquaporin [Nocardia terrae]MVU83091.1 AraC family transcriptional regulator [Nocardia terrae]